MMKNSSWQTECESIPSPAMLARTAHALHPTDRDRELLRIAQEHAEEITATSAIVRGAHDAIMQAVLAETDLEADVMIGEIGIADPTMGGLDVDHIGTLMRILLGRIILAEPLAPGDDWTLAEEQLDPDRPGRTGVYVPVDDLERGASRGSRIGAPWTMLCRNAAKIMHRKAHLPIVENAMRIIDDTGAAYGAKRENGVIQHGELGDASSPMRMVLEAPAGWRTPRNARQFAEHVEHGMRLARQVTESEESASNLLLLLTDPILRCQQQAFGVWAGDGGNGKGSIAGALEQLMPRAARGRWVRAFHIDRFARGDYQSEGEAKAFAGSIYQIDYDAADVGIRETACLKSPAVGEPMTARAVGEAGETIRPRGIPLILTNELFDTSMTPAMERRLVQVSFRHADSTESIQAWRADLLSGGICDMILAGIRLWEQGTEYQRVTTTRIDQMTPAEIDYARLIVEHGFAPSGDGVVEGSRPLSASQRARMGLDIDRTSKRTCRIGGAKLRKYPLIVIDEQRFAPYRAAAEKAIANDGDADDTAASVTPVAAPTTPVSTGVGEWRRLLSEAGE